MVKQDSYSAGDLVSRYLRSMGSNPGEGITKNWRKQIYRSNIVGLMFRRVIYIDVPDHMSIWTVRVRSGPYTFTRTVRPYAYGPDRIRILVRSEHTRTVGPYE